MNLSLENMELGDVQFTNGGVDRFLRVAGGWVHTIFFDQNTPTSSCFIPYDNEFDGRKTPPEITFN